VLCPLLQKFGLERQECQGSDCSVDLRRREMTVCFWARWHMLDPHTGKPAVVSPQRELFK
jgi:hypothetical protein